MGLERRQGRPRIDDVARAAGVSKTAVSFAFNSPERLAVETALRIREVAENLGYRPDPIARLLSQGRTMTLGVLTPQALAVMFSNPFFSLFGEGVAEAAEELGYELHLIPPVQGSLAVAVDRAAVDGVVAIGLSADHPEVGHILTAGLPLVFVDSDDLPGHSSVVVDDESGARAAAEHVARLGHRDVLVLAIERAEAAFGGADRRGVTERRLAGYRAGLEQSGRRLLPDHVVADRASIDGGTAAFEGAWRAGLRPTAVLAMSDAMAIGAIRAARERGLRAPRQLSVVGFDDIALARDIDPPLTTVRQPIREKGRRAVGLLAAAIAAEGRPEHVRLGTELIVRASTAPAP